MMGPSRAALPAFDANTLALEPGLRLLEASAGTGKTFALAHLVLRLVTERQLSLRQLLVVTYTEAAAAELRDRIGRRLQQALEGIEALAAPSGEPVIPPPSVDPVLAAWLGQLSAPAAAGRLRGRLLLALEELDGADITTIHGFCRRNLQRQALEAGMGPGLELDGEGDLLAEEVVNEYWQQQVLPLPVHLVRGLTGRGIHPEGLLELVRGLESDPGMGLMALPAGWQGDAPLQAQLPAWWSRSWLQFRALWEQRGPALEQALCAQASRWRAQGVKATPYAPKPRTDRVGALNGWLDALSGEDCYDGLGERPALWLRDYFHPGAFSAVGEAAADAAPEPVVLPEKPLMEAVAAVVDGPVEALLSHFCHWARAELGERRRRAGRLSYGDLLLGLDPGPGGDRRQALMGALRQRYHAALVDEFQDTDPIQWRTLRQAFTAGPEPRLLVIVGDPKQAIYRFRGGDLATYLAARRQADAVPGAVLGLRRNFRSSSALIEALNRLMEPGLVRSQLDVPAVEAQQRPQPLALLLPAGESPLQGLWLGPDPGGGDGPDGAAGRLPSRSGLEHDLPRRVGGVVVDLLSRGLQLRRGSEEPRPLSPADICLLVNRHAQAEALRRALEERHIASRLVSQGDVFESEGAAILQRLLDALAEPGSGRRQRLLAASPLLGWSPLRLATAPEADWDGLADRVARLAAGLRERGLLAVLSELLGGEGLARLTIQGRLLADVQQTAELVQDQMHRERIGAGAIADWLRRRRLHPPLQTPESHQPHSDVEAAAVGVVTVHRSKGLEFPVVICPYLWQAPPPSRRLGCRWMPPGADAPRLDLHADRRWGEGRQAGQQAWLAEVEEAERLAYVALTRAMHLLVLAYGPAAGQGANPLLPWLFPQLPIGPSHPGEQPDAGIGPADAHGAIHWLPPQPTSAPLRCWVPPVPGGVLALGPRPQRALGGGWGRSSYSSWTHGGGLGPEALEEGRETDALSASLEPSVAAAPGADGAAADPLRGAHGPLESFPRGATAGEALHRILERVDHGSVAATDPSIAALVERELERAGIERRQGPAVLAGLDLLRLTPMGGALAGFRLADLPLGRRLNELSFDVPLSGEGGALVRSSGLAAVFRDHPGGRFGPAYARRLAVLPVASRGFLTGSIDLVFTAPDPRGQERWWVADWKSNWLGTPATDHRPLACGPLHYTPEAMTELMAVNHYPLQAHLYLVALHRYLGWRLPGYRPERHLGGYAYVFLRGVPGAAATSIARRQGPVAGMVVEAVNLGRLRALDALLREGQP